MKWKRCLHYCFTLQGTVLVAFLSADVQASFLLDQLLSSMDLVLFWSSWYQLIVGFLLNELTEITKLNRLYTLWGYLWIVSEQEWKHYFSISTAKDDMSCLKLGRKWKQNSVTWEEKKILPGDICTRVSTSGDIAGVRAVLLQVVGGCDYNLIAWCSKNTIPVYWRQGYWGKAGLHMSMFTIRAKFLYRYSLWVFA